MNTKTVWIAGGSGFVGGDLLKQLLVPTDATCYSAVAFFAGFAGSGVELE